MALLEQRKRRHIEVCLDGDVGFEGVTTGLERYRLPYNALTQTRLDAVDLATEFLGVPLRAPVLVGAMTGGAELSGVINRNLAIAAQRLGIGMMLGSQRVMFGNVLGERSGELHRAGCGTRCVTAGQHRARAVDQGRGTRHRRCA